VKKLLLFFPFLPFRTVMSKLSKTIPPYDSWSFCSLPPSLLGGHNRRRECVFSSSPFFPFTGINCGFSDEFPNPTFFSWFFFFLFFFCKRRERATTPSPLSSDINRLRGATWLLRVVFLSPPPSGGRIVVEVFFPPPFPKQKDNRKRGRSTASLSLFPRCW